MGIFESVLSGGSISRTQQQQAEVDAQTAFLSLYYSPICPYCIRVKQHIAHLGLKIKMLDTLMRPECRNELVRQGGSGMVPCLRIEEADGVRWMYESADIMIYLQQRFSVVADS